MSDGPSISGADGRKPNGVDSRTVVANRLRAAERAKAVPVVVTTPERINDLCRIRSRHPGKSTVGQVRRMLEAMLVLGSITVPEAQQHLLVSHPEQCVHLLRGECSFEVVSEEVQRVNQQGELRDTARYSLLHE